MHLVGFISFHFIYLITNKRYFLSIYFQSVILVEYTRQYITNLVLVSRKTRSHFRKLFHKYYSHTEWRNTDTHARQCRHDGNRRHNEE